MKNHIKRPFRVAIEGNVGAGKSTLIKYFENFNEVELNLEPIETWRDLNGHNLLQLSYSDPQRWNFAFQHNVQLSRLSIQSKSTNKAIQIFERSLQNNRYCFVEMAHDKGLLSSPEFGVICQWYDFIEKNVDIELDLIVYLRTSPDIVYKRMQERNRPEERTIPLEYLEDLHNYYEKWLIEKTNYNLSCPILVIDVDKDLGDSQRMDMYKAFEDAILGKIPVIQN
ncbi:Hypothetical protein CINCED_3A006053 [Cinara cedri]|nr:Hypothetical protein CINCED_3A006053 [Cinara cedri]